MTLVPSSGGASSLVLAVGYNLILTQHVGRTQYSMSLTTGCSGASAQMRVADTAIGAHFIFALLAFAFLFPFGATCALCHPRGTPNTTWFEWHRGIQIAGCVCAVLAGGTGYYHMEELSENHFTQLHHNLGLVLGVFALFQVINGLFRPQPNEAKQPKEPSKPRQGWYIVHRIFAILILYLGIYNMYLGPILFQAVFLGAATQYQVLGVTFDVVTFIAFVNACCVIVLVGVTAAAGYAQFVRKPYDPNQAAAYNVAANASSFDRYNAKFGGPPVGNQQMSPNIRNPQYADRVVEPVI